MNDEAYRIFAMPPSPGDVGRSFADVFAARPEVVRALGDAFESDALPSRVELRLPDLDRVIGYTLSQVRDGLGLKDPGIAPLVAALGQVNRRLWEVEDDLRLLEKKQSFGEDFVRLARAVYRENDRRAALKRHALGPKLVQHLHAAIEHLLTRLARDQSITGRRIEQH